ncbi:hypothetical protein P5609_012570 [Bacillus licheniformis]|uniref:hypothetical protein n=1 Tax=Bacillus licheniformis TaxID=1402 RepID=UPI00115E6B01|nr:hypothetical protein [Bacillus licheniformis]MBW7632567.1 hypothetical protein [Bacillus licheniformis]MDH3163824.1 hypothetical protein [Bacillus licheniformis]MED4409617.1 hypothetical protein [Bacillus licheniformis]QDL80048.1 hypothetical protein D9Y32_22825 [Bacillus licheniformis]
MAYKWEKECLQKYGKEETFHLIEEQRAYERKHKDNPCNNCGNGNQGAILEYSKGKLKGKPFLMRYGLWSNKRCEYCGRHQ